MALRFQQLFARRLKALARADVLIENSVILNSHGETEDIEADSPEIESLAISKECPARSDAQA